MWSLPILIEQEAKRHPKNSSYRWSRKIFIDNVLHNGLKQTARMLAALRRDFGNTVVRSNRHTAYFPHPFSAIWKFPATVFPQCQSSDADAIAYASAESESHALSGTAGSVSNNYLKAF